MINFFKSGFLTLLVLCACSTLVKAQYNGGNEDGFDKGSATFIDLDGSTPAISVPTVSDQTNCGSGVANLTAATGSGGTTCRWYNASIGGTLLATGTSYTTPSLTSTTSYYVSSYDESGFLESKRVSLTVTVVYADAGADENTSSSSVMLNATNPTGSGAWSVISGTGSFDNSSDPSATVSSLTDGINTFRWTLASCDEGSSFDDVNITYIAPYNIFSGSDGDGFDVSEADFILLDGSTPAISVPTASDYISCQTGTVPLSATPGSGGTTCRWYNASIGGTLLATGTSYTTPSLTSTTSYYVSSYDAISFLESNRIEVQAIIALADAGPDQNLLVANSASMNANNPTGAGTWSVISGSGTIVNVNSPTTSITDLVEGANIFRWTLDNCDGGSSFDDVTLTYVAPYLIFYGGDGDGHDLDFSFGTYLDGSGRPGSGTTFSLDGFDDQATIDHASALDLTDGTIEFWIYPNWTASSKGYNPTILAKQQSGTYRYCIKMLDDLSGIGVYDGTTLGTITYSFSQGAWYHVAVVESGSDSEVFVDGISQGLTGVAFGSGTAAPLYVGSDENSDFFEGMIDELRIWDIALTQTNIRDYMCRKITTAHSSYGNLVGYWKFDEGLSIRVNDEANNIAGTLNLYPTWVASGAAIGDQSSHAYSSPTNHSFSVTDIGILDVTLNTGTVDGIQIYYVDQDPNDTSLPATLAIMDEKYFGVHMIGSSYTYDIEYDYTNNTKVIDESKLQLAFRSNSADTWADLNGTLDISTNLISQTGLTGSEYILAGTESSALPITLVSFTGKILDQDAVLNWITLTERSNDYFSVEKSLGKKFAPIGMVKGSGDSNEKIEYQFIDKGLGYELTYYRLKQVDFDGSYEYSEVISLLRSFRPTFIAYPNPAKNELKIYLETKMDGLNYFLINSQGGIVKKGNTKLDSNELITINLIGIPSGLYTIILNDKRAIYTKTIMILK